MPTRRSLPEFWISIDPGDKHVGYASWDYEECTAAVEMTPDQAIDTVWDLAGFGVIKLLVCERFTLYPWLAAQMSHSELYTPQMIGALAHIARRHSIPFEKPQASKLNDIYDHPYLCTRLTKSIGHGKHARDAEAHGLRLVVQLELQRAGFA
jgi:hypothetical protein